MQQKILPGIWMVDPAHSRVRFRVRHLGFAPAIGTFGAFSGRLELGEAPDGGSASGTVEVGSVATGDAARDEFLRSAAFFDAVAFPEMTFASTASRWMSATGLRVVGDLMIAGSTVSSAFMVTFTSVQTTAAGTARATVAVSGQINRRDFGLTFGGPSDKLVGDRVRIELRLSAVRT